MLSKRVTRSHLTRIAAVVALAAGLLVVSASAQQQGAANQSGVTVGTYEPQQLFNQHPDTQALMQELQGMQQQMQQAQQQGNREKLTQLQQQMQQKQQQAIEKFQNELQQTAVDVAGEQGIDVVAVQIIHTADEVQVQDMTTMIANKFQGGQQQQGGGLPGMGR